MCTPLDISRMDTCHVHTTGYIVYEYISCVRTIAYIPHVIYSPFDTSHMNTLHPYPPSPLSLLPPMHQLWGGVGIISILYSKPFNQDIKNHQTLFTKRPDNTHTPWAGAGGDCVPLPQVFDGNLITHQVCHKWQSCQKNIHVIDETLGELHERGRSRKQATKLKCHKQTKDGKGVGGGGG